MESLGRRGLSPQTITVTCNGQRGLLPLLNLFESPPFRLYEKDETSSIFFGGRDSLAWLCALIVELIVPMFVDKIGYHTNINKNLAAPLPHRCLQTELLGVVIIERC